jgi:hypothetical protein
VPSLYHIGRSALVWAYDYTVTTQDIDFIEPQGRGPLVELALSLFGEGTAKAEQHGLYLQMVNAGLAPVPWGYKKRATQINGPWEVLRVFRLAPNDLAATKLRRFLAKDRADIRLLCDLAQIDSAGLEAALIDAYPLATEKDGDEFRDSAFMNLRTVQRYLHNEIDEF